MIIRYKMYFLWINSFYTYYIYIYNKKFMIKFCQIYWFFLYIKSYDPFYESPDTPTQIGVAVVFAKSLLYQLPSKSDYKVLDFRSKEAGVINIELLPCNEQGKPLTDKDGASVKDPKQLIDKKINFLLKINNAKYINANYEVKNVVNFFK